MFITFRAQTISTNIKTDIDPYSLLKFTRKFILAFQFYILVHSILIKYEETYLEPVADFKCFISSFIICKKQIILTNK